MQYFKKNVLVLTCTKGSNSDKFLLGNMDISTSVTSIFIALLGECLYHNVQFPLDQCVQTHLIMNFSVTVFLYFTQWNVWHIHQATLNVNLTKLQKVMQATYWSKRYLLDAIYQGIQKLFTNMCIWHKELLNHQSTRGS
jgi:hypothetical protein